MNRSSLSNECWECCPLWFRVLECVYCLKKCESIVFQSVIKCDSFWDSSKQEKMRMILAALSVKRLLWVWCVCFEGFWLEFLVFLRVCRRIVLFVFYLGHFGLNARFHEEIQLNGEFAGKHFVKRSWNKRLLWVWGVCFEGFWLVFLRVCSKIVLFVFYLGHFGLNARFHEEIQFNGEFAGKHFVKRSWNKRLLWVWGVCVECEASVLRVFDWFFCVSAGELCCLCFI